MSWQNVFCGAIVVGNLDVARNLLEDQHPESVDVNTKSPFLGRPLQLAAAWGHEAVVVYLLDRGADPHAPGRNDSDKDDSNVDDSDEDDSDGDSDGDSDWADSNGDDSDGDKAYQVELCTPTDAPHTYRNPSGSALRAAALAGNADIVRLLLRPEYRISADKTEYANVLLAAVRLGQLGIIQLLLETAEKELDEYEGLAKLMYMQACYYGQTAVAHMLLGLDMHIDFQTISYTQLGYKTDVSVLSMVAMLGRARVVNFLLDRGADTNVNASKPAAVLGLEPIVQPLEWAAYCGHEDIVDLLLARGLDPRMALRGAVKGGQSRLVRLLLERLPTLHSERAPDGVSHTVGEEALCQAIRIRNPAIITSLVETGVPLNEPWPFFWGWYPIMMAKWQYGGDWIVNHLLSLGAEDRERGNAYMYDQREENCQIDGTIINERTWEWVGKY